MGVLSKGVVGRVDRLQAVAALSVVFVVALQLIVYPMPLGNWIRGGVLGLLNAMLAMGMALIYRANRVINFAQADLGSVPTAFAAAFILFWGWPYLLGLGAGLVLAIVLGAVVEMAIVRRFRHSPRLVLTVATLGISQLMVVLGILVPRWWGRNLASERITPPLDWKLTVGTFILNSNDLIALIVAPVAIGGVAWFLARSRIGLAVRASAERTDRAASLGIPVARINTLVWAIAAVLAYLALFLKSGITGVPLGYAVGLPVLLQALAALVIGRLERLPTIIAMACALGLLESGVQWNSDSPFVAYPIMAAVMFVVLLAQPTSTSRRDNDATSSWRGADEVRPLSADAKANAWINTIRWTLVAVAVVAVVLFPVVLPVDYVLKASALIAFAIIGMSLVVLTGWAGQLSLGQMAIVGVGAAVSATCTSRWNVDLSLALVIGGLAGAVTAFAVGVPALRLRGLYLAVTTFAFGLAVQFWLLNDRFFSWFPKSDHRFDRLPLFGRIDVSTPTRYYSFSVVVMVVVYAAVRSIRRSRTGRVIVALRENDRAAQSFAIPVVRAKLTAFVISGALAGVGGALYTHLNQSFVITSYSTGESFDVFISAVIGGLGSLGGAFLGALYLRGTGWFITGREWQLLSTGVGVLVVLLVLPGGLGGLWVRARDLVVRSIMGRETSSDEPPAETLLPEASEPTEIPVPEPA
ncbi:MAG: ABC-type branched-chain amino acid transport system, permease component [Ilumatobacteraceae bacterium]|nr:ABC-type branched-chain amino acid transport system, permease component [Ilumatobacteraceae bacterium]